MKSKNEGVCRYCLKTFSSRSMSKHLQSCKAKQQQDAAEAAAGGVQVPIYQLKVVSYGSYWLYFEMKPSRKLSELDIFLRAVWLECCGHLSEFEIDGVQYSATDYSDGWGEKPKSMNVPLRKVMGVKDTFQYMYDFGSTTEVSGQVIGERMGVLNEKVRILARNQPPEMSCSQCDKTADSACPCCSYLFCEECSESEDHEEECGLEADELLPVVNSPRMGVCAYLGDADPDTFDQATA